jgi:hypothetical protein
MKVLDCLLDVLGNVLYPDNVELALGLSLDVFMIKSAGLEFCY